jgi:hypothetical protein
MAKSKLHQYSISLFSTGVPLMAIFTGEFFEVSFAPCAMKYGSRKGMEQIFLSAFQLLLDGAPGGRALPIYETIFDYWCKSWNWLRNCGETSCTRCRFASPRSGHGCSGGSV